MPLKKKLEHATSVDTSNLAAKNDFIALKAEVDKLDINKLVNVPIGLNDLKPKVDDSDVGRLKSVPIDLKKLNDAVSTEVVKKTLSKKLNAKVNSLDKQM